MKKRIIPITIAFILVIASPIMAMAHSGGTDSAGGHHDYNNVSGLGSYHYHHGYGPHLHTNGVCPYSSSGSSASSTNSTSSNSSTSSSSSTTSSKNDSYDDGYGKGYAIGKDDGYDEGHSDGYDEGHSDGYDEGYDEGYNEGHQAGSEESEGDTGGAVIGGAAAGVGGTCLVNYLRKRKTK